MPDGRKWTVESDGSVTDPSAEVVSPVCRWEDIEMVQEVVRAIRETGGRADSSCGIHVHVGFGQHTPASLRRLVNLVNAKEDLLTQARIDAGMFELHPQRVNLRALTLPVITELRHLHPVPIALDCPGAPPRLWADPMLMRQALTNLINNAVAHARNAELITVRVVNADAQILVSVSDDGEGIPDDERRRLFERFQSGKPLRDGTGLGLVITRAIIQMHGGDVFVDSTPNRGTTMLFTLPRDSSHSVEAEQGLLR